MENIIPKVYMIDVKYLVIRYIILIKQYIYNNTAIKF